MQQNGQRQWKSMKSSGETVNKAWGDEPFEFEGHYHHISEGVGTDGNSTIYSFKSDNGEEHVCWGSKVLDDQMSKIDIGEYVMIRYLGKAKSKTGKTYNAFEVLRDESASTVTEAPAAQSAPVAGDVVKKQVNVTKTPVAASNDPFGDETDPFA